MQLCKLGRQEDDTTRFPGVMLEQDPETGLLEMKQTGLIKCIIKALWLDDAAKGKFTPSDSKPLVKSANIRGFAHKILTRETLSPTKSQNLVPDRCCQKFFACASLCLFA